MGAELSERLSALCLQLCAIPSITGSEAACADFVEAYLRRYDLEITRVGQTVVARGPCQGRPLILLVGHTDTVPLTQADGQIVDGQFTHPPRLDGQRLYGLGASDMKGGLAVMLALAEDLTLKNLPYDLGFIFYDREEGPWKDSGLGPTLDALPWLLEADLAFCLEPSENVVQLGCMGSMHARVVFEGQAAHSARPWQGDNAIHAAGQLLRALAERQPHGVDCHGFLFKEVLSATLAKGGSGRNVIPDYFELNLNYRFAPGKSLAIAEAELRDFVQSHLRRGEIFITDRSPSGRVVLDNIYLKQFIERTKAPIAPKQAWTDVARFSEAGVDAVNLGPGISAQAHQAGEWADVSLIAESYRQFRGFLEAACQDMGGLKGEAPP